VAGRQACWAALALALVVAVAAHVRGAVEHPNNQDRELDLLLARRIAAEGVLTDGARSPLFPALLAPFEGEDEGFYERSRWVSLVVGALAFAVVVLAARRAFGDRVALLSAFVLGPEWSFQVSRIRPEPLAAALLVLVVARLAGRVTAGHPRRDVLIAGAFAGASHLAKGSGPLTLAAGIVFLALAERRRALVPVALWVAGFMAAASPLLIDTARRFGNPFYNVNSAHVMWEDAGSDQQWRWSTATPQSWWAHHGLEGTLARLGEGFLRMTHGPWLYAFLAAAALGALLQRRRAPGPSVAAAWIGAAACLVLVWLPPFAWYEAIGHGRRYVFPLLAVAVPALIALLDGGIRRAVPRLHRSCSTVLDRVGRVVGTVAAVAVASALLVAAEVRESADPPVGGIRRPFDAETLAAAERLRALPVGSRVLAGPAAAVPSPWLVYPRVEYVYLPSGLSLEAAERWMRAHADFVLLTANLRDVRPEAFASWIRGDYATGIAEATTPAWAEPEWHSASEPVRYLLFRVTP
jgi:hypothetical protein